MDFTYTPEQDKLRAELRVWLEKTSCGAAPRKGEGLGGLTASLLDVRDDTRWGQLLDYHRRLLQGRLCGAALAQGMGRRRRRHD